MVKIILNSYITTAAAIRTRNRCEAKEAHPGAAEGWRLTLEQGGLRLTLEQWRAGGLPWSSGGLEAYSGAGRAEAHPGTVEGWSSGGGGGLRLTLEQWRAGGSPWSSRGLEGHPRAVEGVEG